MPVTNTRGASLIEVLLACCLVSGAVITLSLAFPTASKNIARTRKSWVAANLANSYIASIESQPYTYLDPTDATYFGVGIPTCDCSALDFAILPSTTTQSAGTTFVLRSCVNYVNSGAGNTWTSQCPSTGDSGYKKVLVRVYWTNGFTTYSVVQASSMSRF